MAIKSVPPLVARPIKQSPMAKPFIMPPKMQMSSTSLVSGTVGMRSVSTLVNKIMMQE